MTRTRTVAIIVAAGKGERLGGASPKQFAILAGRPMLAYSHAALASHPRVDSVLVVVGEGQEAKVGDDARAAARAIGGATRRESVCNALEAVAASGGADQVLIHDAARPFVPPAVIDRLLDALDQHAGAVPVLPIADTLARGHGVMGEGVARDGLHRVQTPQAFRFDVILDAHRRWPEGEEATDDAGMARRFGHEVALVEGSTMLDKVTYPADVAAAEARLASVMRVRSASGYDVHRFAEGEQLWLGGVLIPHEFGLSGHSDADVALHAITDALLGCIGAGDIGTHFPPSDPQWKGAKSGQFLRHAAMLVREVGGVIDFVDLTIICEAPRIGPHRDAIRARVAELLALQPGQVSVKATTTERLGFTGRGEGMAAQAIATVRVPEMAA